MMRARHINQWLTLGANFGVLIGVILLLVELQQNSTMMRSQIRYEVSQGIVDLMSLSAGNEQLASVLRRADDGEELTPDELRQFRHRTIALFRYLENLHYQYRQGLFDEAEFSTQKIAWSGYLNSSEAAVRVWCFIRPTVSPEFRSEIDTAIKKPMC